jgi:cobalt-zinc-cadmium efflux system outer membrane protein
MRDAASRPIYNPQLSLFAENAETDTRALGVSQTLDWNGKRKARTAVAESDRLVKKAHYLGTRWDVTIDLLDGLARHQTGVERDVLADSRRRFMAEFATLAERRFQAGDLAQVELDLARLALADARMQKASTGARLAEARQAVNNLTPVSTKSTWPLLPGMMPALPMGAADAESIALTLPDVMAARRQVESANALVELRRRQRRPDPTLTLAGGEEEGEPLVGLNISIPLFVRNRFSYEVTAAMAELNQAEEIERDLTQRALARLVSATERYELARNAWREWESAGQISLARRTEELQKLWQVGELSTADYLVQMSATLDVQVSALDLRETLWRAWFEWLSASGQIDLWLGQGDYQ